MEAFVVKVSFMDFGWHVPRQGAHYGKETTLPGSPALWGVELHMLCQGPVNGLRLWRGVDPKFRGQDGFQSPVNLDCLDGFTKPFITDHQTLVKLLAKIIDLKRSLVVCYCFLPLLCLLKGMIQPFYEEKESIS